MVCDARAQTPRSRSQRGWDEEPPTSGCVAFADPFGPTAQGVIVPAHHKRSDGTRSEEPLGPAQRTGPLRPTKIRGKWAPEARIWTTTLRSPTPPQLGQHRSPWSGEFLDGRTFGTSLSCRQSPWSSRGQARWLLSSLDLRAWPRHGAAAEMGSIKTVLL